MSESIFTTAVRDPVTPEFDCSVRVVERNNAQIGLPKQLSPRIANRSLVDSLKKDTSLRVTLSPRNKNRARIPPNTQPLTKPKFNRLPSLNVRCRPAREMCKEAQDALNDPSTIPNDIEILRVIAADLRSQRDHISDTGDYKEAYKYQKTLQIVETKLTELQTHEGELNNLHNLMARHQEMEMIVTALQQDWDKNFEAFLKTTEQDQAEMQARHEKELEDYDQTVPTEIAMKFRKRSPRILALRVREARLALGRQYAAANKLKEITDMEEEKEAESAMDKTYQEWISKRERLIKAQEREKEAFLSHAESTRKNMVLARDKRISGYLKRMSNLNKDIGWQCALKNVKDEDLDGELDQEWAEHVVSEQMKETIPASRSGAVFTAQRQKRHKGSPRGKKQMSE